MAEPISNADEALAPEATGPGASPAPKIAADAGPSRIERPPPSAIDQAERAQRTPGQVASQRAYAAAGSGLLAFVAAFLVPLLLPYLRADSWANSVSGVLFALSAALFLLGVVRAFLALATIWRGPEPRGGPVLAAIIPLIGGSFMALVGAFLALWASMGFARGRQLRRFGRVLLPEVAPGEAWALPEPRLAPLSTLEEPALRAALAARWRENGRTEHASVAAFARLALDLLALGAPPALLQAANQDALDEIRHAELCFGLASALDGRDQSPGPFPAAQRVRMLWGPRALQLAQLAVDSLIDGALHEGLSARVLAQLAKRCHEPATSAVLRELAADEGRHAAHGWEVVEWCLAQGGRPVAQALQGAVAALPRRVKSDLPGGARAGAWERHGIHGEALELEEHARALALLSRRVEALTGAV